MELFDRLTRERYNYPNQYSSVKFVDFMMTDFSDSVEFSLPKEAEPIGAVVRGIFGYTRYEPTNPYVFHKVVPSARNVHTNEAYLVCCGNICRYNCKTNSFEFVCYDGREADSFRLVVVAELWRIMKFYGEFGMVLPLLDAGHILAQLKMDLEQVDITRGRIRYGAKDAEEYERLGLSPQSQFISMEIDFSADIQLPHVPIVESSCWRAINYDKEVSSYEISRLFLPYEAGFAEMPLIFDNEALGPFVNSQDRESAHNFIGICSLVEQVSQTWILECAYRLCKNIQHYMNYATEYKVYILYRTTEGERLLTIERGVASQPREWIIDRNRLLHDAQHMIDMGSMPVVVYVSYHYDRSRSEKENIYRAHIGASEIIHYISLAGTERGFFTRPMRNFEDAYLESALKASLGERFMYSLIMGKSNTKNYVWRMPK